MLELVFIRNSVSLSVTEMRFIRDWAPSGTVPVVAFAVQSKLAPDFLEVSYSRNYRERRYGDRMAVGSRCEAVAKERHGRLRKFFERRCSNQTIFQTP